MDQAVTIAKAIQKASDSFKKFHHFKLFDKKGQQK
jgi:hypothetical protein